MIPAAIEPNYLKRLRRAGWRQMGLFQRSVKEIEERIDQLDNPYDPTAAF